MSSDKEATDLSHILEQKNKELEEKNRALELEASLNVASSSALSMITSRIGIPESIIDKIFQPFFNTKPTGQGTGLGMLLSYDIIKTHSGELTIESKLGLGTTMSLILTIKNI